MLGVGAAVTLAAWNSSDFATGTFGTGDMVLTGSADGTNYANHPEDNPADLTFTMATDNLAPGDSVSAPYSLRLSETSTTDATVALNTPDVSNPIDGLTYTVTQSEAFGCDGSQTPWVAEQPLAVADSLGSFDLTQGGGAAGTPQHVCFTVTAGEQADLAPGEQSSVVWEFAATQQ